MHWIILASAILRLRTLPGARAEIRLLLDRPGTIVLVGPRPPAFLAHWVVQTGRVVANPTRICRGRQRALPSLVVLDLEDWPLTPPWARRNPVRAARCVARVLRPRGISLVLAPASDLMLERRWRRLGGTIFSRYLRSGLARRLARYANAYEIQSQGLEFHPRRYARYVWALVREIHAVRPGLPVYAGLSTNPRGPRVRLGTLLEDVQLTENTVTGYWLNVPAPGRACPRCRRPRPALALAFLRALAKKGPG